MGKHLLSFIIACATIVHSSTRRWSQKGGRALAGRGKVGGGAAFVMAASNPALTRISSTDKERVSMRVKAGPVHG